MQNSFKMPKNIRQIGKSNAIKKIYVEDYVMTFIKQLAGGDYSGLKIAVLVGQSIRLENCRNIFITGAVEVKDIDTTGDIIFTNDIWTAIYEDIKKFFVEGEIVGWFLGGPGYLLEDEEKIQKIHVDNFAGQDKVLLTYDNMERDEAFSSFENNKLTKQDGYYIYYEKNEEMQTYMIDCKKNPSQEASYDDRVSREIRTVLQNKKPTEEENKSVTRLMYAAGTLLAVIILVVGAAILSNYDQMKRMQDTLNYLTRNMEDLQTMVSDDGSTQTVADSEDNSNVEGNTLDYTEIPVDSDSSDTDTVSDTGDQSLNVEVVPGDVEPLEDSNTDINTSEDGTTVEDTGTEEDNDKTASTVDEPTDDISDEDAEQATQEASEDTKVVQEVNYYVVVNGDTLADISYKLYQTYTKVKTIMELNKISDPDLIYVGQKLIVP
jgi:LysM repeat protein